MERYSLVSLNAVVIATLLFVIGYVLVQAAAVLSTVSGAL